MKIFSYEQTGGSERLLELAAATVCFESPEEARKFAEFAMKCAADMKAMGTGYDHEHLIDFDEEQFPYGKPDIVIARLIEESK